MKGHWLLSKSPDVIFAQRVSWRLHGSRTGPRAPLQVISSDLKVLSSRGCPNIANSISGRACLRGQVGVWPEEPWPGLSLDRSNRFPSSPGELGGKGRDE